MTTIKLQLPEDIEAIITDDQRLKLTETIEALVNGSGIVAAAFYGIHKHDKSKPGETPNWMGPDGSTMAVKTTFASIFRHLAQTYSAAADSPCDNYDKKYKSLDKESAEFARKSKISPLFHHQFLGLRTLMAAYRIHNGIRHPEDTK